eukprot:7216312-Alexandrium_andersonii.AAC.1
MYNVTADGKTAYQHLHYRCYDRPVLVFGEKALFMALDLTKLKKVQNRWFGAIWVGKSWWSDEHLGLAEFGVVRSRGVRRVPLS